MDKKKSEIEVNTEPSNCEEEKAEKKNLEKPELEDVSGKVMAQPYIRFT